jgi:dihydroorotate dehydrogenase (fumarate)
VHSADEVVKYILAGADAVMVASALLQHGAGFIKTLVHELEAWMEPREYESVEKMKGMMSRQNVADPSAFERANYIKVLESYKSPYLAP